MRLPGPVRMRSWAVVRASLSYRVPAPARVLETLRALEFPAHLAPLDDARLLRMAATLAGAALSARPLVWDDKALFRARIEAWANGPVIPSLYRQHRGCFKLSEWKTGDPSSLTATERETVDAIIRFYGERSPQWLSDLTHMETPWISARQGLDATEAGHHEITLESMAEYYGSLQ